MTRYATTLTSYARVRRKENRLFTRQEVISNALHIIKGLEQLHQHNIIHRDLKSDNIFLTMNPHGNIECMAIGDFDTAKVITEVNQAMTTLGTPGYIVSRLRFLSRSVSLKSLTCHRALQAPEVMAARSKSSYGFSADSK